MRKTRSNKVYGERKGDLWERTVSFKKGHLYGKYQGFGFHLSFRTVFEDHTLRGCQITEADTGQVWFIDRATWLTEAFYVKHPKPQYVVPLKAFQTVSTGLSRTATERHVRRRKARTDLNNTTAI